MIVVTGSNGFIGSNLIKNLNLLGHTDILAVDDLSNKNNLSNIAEYKIKDLMGHKDFLVALKKDKTLNQSIKYIFHQGACSDTTEWDADYLIKNNYLYSKNILDFCIEESIPLTYASSASVYGNNIEFKENKLNEKPINLYAYSKYIFDQLVRSKIHKTTSQVVGLRYFNVYGPKENHKGKMASVALHLHQELMTKEEIKLFGAYNDFAAGEQSRDFIYIDDVVDVNLWFMENPKVSGIFNVGTGRSQTFNEVAQAVIEWNKKGKISYIPFPDELKGSYQSYTKADISKLRTAGYTKPFKDVQTGIKHYLDNYSTWPGNE